jgi:hypothetical protein
VGQQSELIVVYMYRGDVHTTINIQHVHRYHTFYNSFVCIVVHKRVGRLPSAVYLGNWASLFMPGITEYYIIGHRQLDHIR